MRPRPHEVDRPPETKEREPAWVVTAFDRNHFDRAGHVLVRNLDDRRSKIDHAHPGVRGERAERRRRLVDIQRHPPAQKIAGIQAAKHQVGIGDGWFDAALAIAGRSGRCAGALGTDAQESSGIDPGDAPAAGTDRLDVD